MLILGNYYRQQFGCVARSEWMTEELGAYRTVYSSSYYMTRKNDEEGAFHYFAHRREVVH